MKKATRLMLVVAIMAFVAARLFLGGQTDAQVCDLDPKFIRNTLNEGVEHYVDRGYIVTSVPPEYIGLAMIKTPNSDKGEPAASGYLTFEMPDDGTVYVAFDQRASTLPDWLGLEFFATGDEIDTSDVPLDVYEKSYLKGDCVDLGGNSAPGSGWPSADDKSNYIVFYTAEISVTGCTRPKEPIWDICGAQWVDHTPNPRFAIYDPGTPGDESDDIVLDKETGLVWARDANLDGRKTWEDAVIDCRNLNIGNRKGWRLPTVEELASLVYPSQSDPAVPVGHPFINVQSSHYWSTTPCEAVSADAWNVYMGNGYVLYGSKGAYVYVWPVRGGSGPILVPHTPSS